MYKCLETGEVNILTYFAKKLGIRPRNIQRASTDPVRYTARGLHFENLDPRAVGDKGRMARLCFYLENDDLYFLSATQLAEYCGIGLSRIYKASEDARPFGDDGMGGKWVVKRVKFSEIDKTKLFEP